MKKLLFVAVAITVVLALMFSAIGCEGSVGPQGLQGSSGPQGIKGDKGARGPAGEQGLRGVQGPEGDKGERGAKGKQGDDGDRGYTGVRGLKGATGEQGLRGEKGDKGDTGGCYINVTVNQPFSYLTLVEKNSTTWQPVAGGASGVLVYSPFGNEFAYEFTACGLDADTGYTLIYYADYEARFNQWGGDNPGAVIAVGVSDSSGGLLLGGEVELGMSLPSVPDANISAYDYSGDPDFYAHAHGAKIWLVPTDCLTNDSILPVDTWSPGRFLFETDLIVYIDTNS